MSRRLWTDLRESFRHFEFWTYSSWLDITVRYRRTKLGLSWLMLAFAFFVLMMGWKFAFLMNMDVHYFLPYVAVGYLVWRFIVTVLNDVVACYSKHASYIMDGRTRLTDYLLRSMAIASFNMAFALVVLAALLAIMDVSMLWRLPSILLTMPLVMVNVFWISVCMSLLGARLRDMQELLGTVLMAGFLLTPIIWDVSRYPADSMRGVAARLNPAFHLLDVVRSPVLGHWPEATSIAVTLAMAASGWVLAAFMYRRYARFVPLWVV